MTEDDLNSLENAFSGIDKVDEEAKAELDGLKRRAEMLNMKFHPNIGAETLRVRIRDHLAAEELKAAEAAKHAAGNSVMPSSEVAPTRAEPVDPEHQARLKARADALALMRIRVTCMDPSMKEYDGDFFTAGNSVVGTVKRYVPYEADWHVERIILNMIKDKKYQSFSTSKTPGGGSIKRGKLVRAFAVTELAPLTDKQMHELRQRQIMAKGQTE